MVAPHSSCSSCPGKDISAGWRPAGNELDQQCRRRIRIDASSRPAVECCSVGLTPRFVGREGRGHSACGRASTTDERLSPVSTQWSRSISARDWKRNDALLAPVRKTWRRLVGCLTSGSSQSQVVAPSPDLHPSRWIVVNILQKASDFINERRRSCVSKASRRVQKGLAVSLGRPEPSLWSQRRLARAHGVPHGRFGGRDDVPPLWRGGPDRAARPGGRLPGSACESTASRCVLRLRRIGGVHHQLAHRICVLSFLHLP